MYYNLVYFVDNQLDKIVFDQNQRSGDESLLPKEMELKTLALALKEIDTESIALLKSLKADYDDCLAIVLGENNAWKLWKYAKIRYKEASIQAIKAKPGQTEIIIHAASTNHLKQGNISNLPNGYNSVATKFQDNLIRYSLR